MHISYTGRHEVLPAKLREKLEVKLQKIAKMLDRQGEREAHVILSVERRMHCVEITIRAFDHALVGKASDAVLATACTAALEKLEKQVVKLRTKWRDGHRHKENVVEAMAEAPASALPAPSKSRKNGAAKVAVDGKGNRKNVFRVDNRDGRKPMTLDEAILEMEASQEYLVYRDALTDRVSVLLRRRDGHFDLIES